MEKLSFLNNLNDQQRRAVTHIDGPVLVIAGAGSGKTRVLTYRIAYLLYKVPNLQPNNIIALTFTNKAANEMKSRLTDISGDKAQYIWMGTFHSLFGRILRREAQHIGYDRNFSIYDMQDAQKIVKNILKEESIDIERYKPKSLLYGISALKNTLTDMAQIAVQNKQTSYEKVLYHVYPLYIQYLKQNNAMDFDDLLVQFIYLLQNHQAIRQYYQERFRYILIDEYQDTNHAQYMAIQLLVNKEKNICVVGDDSQSIYSFRGANINNILNFRHDYDNVTEIPLEQNYRSTQMILDCADSIIKKNSKRLKKKLWTDNDEGQKILLFRNDSTYNEAENVIRNIQEYKMRYDISNNNFAILYRTNYQSRAFEDVLKTYRLPYQVIGGMSFYRRAEIKDVISYLLLVNNYHDEEALWRIINNPIRGVGMKTQMVLKDIAKKNQTKVWDVLCCIDDVPISSNAKEKIGAFVESISKAHQEFKKCNSGLGEITEKMLLQSGYLNQYIENQTQDALSRYENIREFLNAMDMFPSSNGEQNNILSAFLSDICLKSDTDDMQDEDDRITLITVHSAKGMEFPVVYVVGLEEGLFPHSVDDQEKLEEERRLMYVAITRAMKILVLSYAQNRFQYGESRSTVPSRFLKEINSDVFINPKILRRNNYNSNPSNSLFRKPTSYSSYRPLHETKSINDGQHYDDNLHPGVYVTHHVFGKGKIIERLSSGNDTRLKIIFESRGEKMLLLKYADLNIVK